MSNMEIVLGPPGTGKTTTLLNLVEAEMQDGVSPEKIGYITFTRKGTHEAVERAKKKFGFHEDRLPYFRTIHSLCYRRLGLRASDVLAGKTLYEFANYAGIEVTGRAFSEDGDLQMAGFKEGDRMLFMENKARIRKVSLRQQFMEDDDGLDWYKLLRVSTALQEFKRARGLLDYTDMLLHYVAHEQDAGLDRLFVDESQDLSALQWDVVRLLARSCDRVVVAGDDDQAIFEWAGADVREFVTMKGEASVLGRSYRVPVSVQRIASHIISGVSMRRHKQWAPRDVEGDVDYANKFPDVEIGKEGTVLILARNNYVIREQIEDELRARGIVYVLNDKSSIDAKQLQAASAWEDLKRDREVPLGDARTMYKFISVAGKGNSHRGIKLGFKKLEAFGEDDSVPVTMRELRSAGGLLVEPSLAWHDALDRMPEADMAYMRAARANGEKLRHGKPRIRLSTIHSAKGGEANHVVVMKEMAARTHQLIHKNEDEERRVWYVGVTRAQQRLTIVEAKTNRSCPWI